jgi:hypothetical protein
MASTFTTRGIAVRLMLPVPVVISTQLQNRMDTLTMPTTTQGICRN